MFRMRIANLLFGKHLLAIAIFAVILAALPLFAIQPKRENPVDQVFDENRLTDPENKIVTGACQPNYISSRATPNTSSALSSYIEIVGLDGHTTMCLYSRIKPTRWQFSPDGRYLYTFTLFGHSWAYNVYQISTGKDVCDGRGDENRARWDSNCAPIRMADGRWWSGIFPDVVLKTSNSKLWNLINSSSSFVDPMMSPNQEWVVGKSGEWYVASSDSKIIKQFSLPYSYKDRTACGQNSGLIAWRADSKQFAVIQETDKIVFVWSIADDGSMHQDDAITLDRCTSILKLSPDGKIVTTR